MSGPATIAVGGYAATVLDGSLLVAAAACALVGFLGFLSPCVLPLVPGYLSYLTGLSGTELDDRGRRQRRMVGGALLFALGFTVVMAVSADALFSGLGGALAAHRTMVQRGLGALTVLLGLVFLGGGGFLQREVRFRRRPPSGLWGAPLLGATFGLAWTPCLTPTFVAVIGLASAQATAERGLVLTGAYCFGLSVPFVLVAAGIGWMTGSLAFLRRHLLLIHRSGGVLIVALGILLVTGAWTSLMNDVRAWAGSSGIGSGL